MREKAGSHWREMDIVFCDLYGGYLEPSHLHDAYKRLLRSAELLDISITMDIYSHVLPSIQLEAMDKLDDLFKEKE